MWVSQLFIVVSCSPPSAVMLISLTFSSSVQTFFAASVQVETVLDTFSPVSFKVLNLLPQALKTRIIEIIVR